MLVSRFQILIWEGVCPFDSNLFSDYFQVGKLSTGDSLDMTPHDEASILANDAVIKDMEVSYFLLYQGIIRAI